MIFNVQEIGTVLSVKDGVVCATGLRNVSAGETVKIGDVYGTALNLELNIVSIVIFGNDSTVKEGDTVERTKTLTSVPVEIGRASCRERVSPRV